MKTPMLVADCVAAMRAAVNIPVTVKCRIGVDDQGAEESLFTLVDLVSKTGCDIFIVHARKAWLDGLSPKENREIPPLDYPLVRRLKKERPHLTIILNGGIETIAAAAAHLESVDGVMLGRAAYGAPAILADVDIRIFGDVSPPPRLDDVVGEMSAYVKRMAAQGVSPHHIVRHMLGLYHGRPGARAWRRVLSEQGAATPADILDRAAEMVSDKAPALV
jgi:tRNA-dihydrouridine synthase A